MLCRLSVEIVTVLDRETMMREGCERSEGFSPDRSDRIESVMCNSFVGDCPLRIAARRRCGRCSDWTGDEGNVEESNSTVIEDWMVHRDTSCDDSVRQRKETICQ